METRDDERNRLKDLLIGLDAADIYRSVYDENGELLAEGLEPLHPQLLKDFKQVEFQGRSIVDLGCNFGLFSFLAAELGANHVTGVDALPEIVEGAGILAAMKDVENVSFATFNFEQPAEELGMFDMVMLVDFFGRSNIRKRKIESIINFMKSISNQELLFAIRPLNRIEKDLRMNEADFSGLYPEEYIVDGSFKLLAYITDLLSDEWTISPVSEYDGSFRKHKVLFICTKNQS